MDQAWKTIWVLLLLGGASLALAQPPAAQQTPTPAQVTPPVTYTFRPMYVLGSGDQIMIRVADAPEITDRPFRIDTEGNITMPLLGKIHVAGLNQEQLEAELVKRLKVYIVNPQLSVTVAQYRSEPVFLVGAFKTPGIYPLQGRRTLVETLAATGGLQPNASRRIKITRRNEVGPIPLPNAIADPSGVTYSVDINLSSLRESVNPAEDILLQPFDVLSVDRAEVIYVSGEVSRVGSLELGERDFLTVTQAVTLSGGITHDASKKVRVLRPILNTARRAEIEVDLDRVMKGEANDFPLLPNDILFVPRGAHQLLTRASTVALTLTIPIVSGLALSRF
jgi:polysaccharide export outer membrane protein